MVFKISPILIPFQNSGNKTILKNFGQQFMRVIKLKRKLCTAYIELSKNFEERKTAMDASTEH